MEKDKLVLPQSFLDSVRELLGNEYKSFISSYEHDNYVGLRYNPLKASLEEFLSKMPLTLEKVPWALEGFYYNKDEHPGKSVYHEAGCYYIQEPSAMSAVEVLDPKPGERVFDMCAAPGGKSTQIAGRLMGQGLLVSNEIIKDRARILSSNIERMGVRNALVLNESPDSVSKFFPSFFDKILVDAPCSGEGMFKKEESALSEWSPENVKMCHERQLFILSEAAKMLKAGGRMTYSTCTFNALENEGTVEEFSKTHQEFSLVKSERFWPHKVKGEGHFVALLQKEGILQSNGPLVDSKKSKKDPLADIKDFLRETLSLTEEAIEEITAGKELLTFGENVYLLPREASMLKGLRVERPGLHVAVLKKNRLEPAHSLALALRPFEVLRSVDLTVPEAERYIRGETLSCDSSLKGWVLLTVNGFSIGFGKASAGVIKNHFPKGLRKY